MNKSHVKLRLMPLAVTLATLGTGNVYGSLEEVVVTAQKRQQNTQDVGIAITAFSGDSLKELGISEPSDLAAQTPGVDIKYSDGRTNPVITIRGVGLNDNRPNNNPSTAVHIDEVYLASAAYLTSQLFDLERVETLKGPQGTLYGRNSTAGTINFISKAPSQEFDAYLDLDYGNYNSLNTQSAVGGALSEVLSGRLAFDYKKSDGYVTNRGTMGLEEASPVPGVIPDQPFFGKDDKAGEVDVFSWRASLLFEPSDTFDATISLHGSKDTSANNIWAIAPKQATTLSAALTTTPFIDVDGDPHDRYEEFRPELDSDNFGGRITLNYDLAFATLTSVTGYEELDRSVINGDGVPYFGFRQDKDEELSQITQEIRLTSNNDSDFLWILGAYYSEDEVDVTELTKVDRLLFTHLETDYVQDSESYAVFAHIEWQFTETLKLTTGIRYTEEEKDFDGGSTDINPFGVSFLRGLTATAENLYEAEEWTGKVGLDWILNDKTLLYISYSTGFKSGGVDGSTILDPRDLTPFLAEFVDSYEAGFKWDSPKGTSRLNGSFFYYDYDDMQAQAFVVNPTTGLSNTLRTNVGNASVKGVELEWVWLPADGWTINLGLSYLDSEIEGWDSDDPAEVALHEGNNLQDAPELTFNGMVRYDWSLSNGMNASVMSDFNYNDEVYRTLDNESTYLQDSYSLINGRISLTSQNDDWTLSLWVRNLTDGEYEVNLVDTPTTGLWHMPGAPRTYGINLNYRWY